MDHKQSILRWAVCDPSGLRSCHRAKRGPASGESPSKRLTRFSLCRFVSFVVFVKSAEGATVWASSCRRVVNAAEGRTPPKAGVDKHCRKPPIGSDLRSK